MNPKATSRPPEKKGTAREKGDINLSWPGCSGRSVCHQHRRGGACELKKVYVPLFAGQHLTAARRGARGDHEALPPRRSVAVRGYPAVGSPRSARRSESDLSSCLDNDMPCAAAICAKNNS